MEKYLRYHDPIISLKKEFFHYGLLFIFPHKIAVFFKDIVYDYIYIYSLNFF